MAEELGIGSRIQHPKFGEGVLVDVDHEYYTIYFREDAVVKTLSKEFELQVLEKQEAEPIPFDPADIEKAVRKTFLELVDRPEPVALGGKWIGGKIEIIPGDREMSRKELPIHSLFHKVVMVRDRLRVLEQNINSHEKLDDEDKVHLQQYITRAYGSLTTFNVLFQSKDHHFKGASTKD